MGCHCSHRKVALESADGPDETQANNDNSEQRGAIGGMKRNSGCKLLWSLREIRRAVELSKACVQLRRHRRGAAKRQTQ